MTKKTWAIWAYDYRTPLVGSIIQSSVGKPYASLRTLAHKCCFNGDGSRYTVVQVTSDTHRRIS